MCRYMVVCFHDGFSEEHFDSYQNLRQLTGFISDLKHQYAKAKQERLLFRMN